MKRLFVFAAAAASLMAISCQKTYVVDEVNTPIGFSADLGKQTKAIMDGTAYAEDHTFGVFAYALTNNLNWEDSFDPAATGNVVMNKVEIGYDNSDNKWRAKGTKKYYWPNDSETHLNFFMYSPYADLNPFASVTKEYGLTITDYVHSKHMGLDAVDMMVASAKDKNYTNVGDPNGTVRFTFGHKMTQVVFVVKKDSKIADAEITLNSLKLNGINNKGTYKEETNAWETTLDAPGTFDITTTDGLVDTDNGITLDGATMLPQDLTEGQQKIEIVYTIANSNGFAGETVTKEFDIRYDTLTSWGINQKITYTLTITMNEILFNPSVATWDDSTTGTIEVPAV